MDSNLQAKVDAHQISLDLGGLEELLSAGIENEVFEVEPVEVAEQGEGETILRLLQELTTVAGLMQDTRERLESANERMSSMATMVQIQSQQLEMLTHYQSQASRVAGLEHKITLLKQEIIRLRRPWLKRLYDYLTK